MLKNWKPGINHIEFWVASLKESIPFYEGLFEIIGWEKINEVSFSTGNMEIYFKQANESLTNTLGPRHICFQAVDRRIVDEVGLYLEGIGAKLIRGPIEMDHYSKGYYTVDFHDPNGYVLEVAYTPNMEL